MEVDGAIAQISRLHQLAQVMTTRLPVVNIANAIADIPRPSVLTDDTLAGRLAREHFHERGLTRLAFCGPAGLAFSRDRYAGLAAGQADLPVHWLPQPMEIEQLRPAALVQFSAWLQQLSKPVGLLGATDRYARLALQCALSAGLAVPDDLAILGVNNDPVECELAEVPLSSIQLNSRRQGLEAAALLDRLLAGADDGPVSRIPPERVVVRQSSDVLAVGEPTVATALAYLRAHLGGDASIEAAARAAGVSRRSLELRFRRTLGRSPYEELLRLRVNRARELLHQRQLRISEVAELAGFGEARLLERHFRRAIGRSPSAFRRQLGEP